jgi:hypothetical protein
MFPVLWLTNPSIIPASCSLASAFSYKDALEGPAAVQRLDSRENTQRKSEVQTLH